MNWNKSKLKDVTEIITKGTTPTTIGYNYIDEGINFIKIESITDNGDFLLEKMSHISEECNKKMSRSQLRENDIVFSIAGAIGKTAIIKKEILPANTNQALAIIRLNTDEIDKEFLLKSLRSEYILRQFNKKKQGVAQLNLSLKDIAELEIVYPSIDEQKEIVRVLDKTQELIDKRKEQIEALDELVKSKFVEMFGDPIRNINGWDTKKMNDVAPIINYKGIFNEEKVWLLNLDMVEPNTGNIIKYNYVSIDEIGNSTCTFDTTNILYSKLRPYLNKVVIPNKIGYATSEMLPLQPIKGVLNRHYIAHMLRNKMFVDYISEKVSGAKMPRVNMDDFKNFEVPLPPIELQNQFADFVDKVDKLKAKMEESLKELEDNFNSLMQRAFKGELFN